LKDTEASIVWANRNLSAEVVVVKRSAPRLLTPCNFSEIDVSDKNAVRFSREFGGSISEFGLVGGLVLVLVLENADVSPPERWNKITTGGSDSLFASSQ
jgi:hypothetical protein